MSAESQHGESHPWQRSWGRGLMGKGKIRPRGVPLLEHLPQNQNLSVFSWLSPTLLTLTGGCPWPPFSGKRQLRALANKSPGQDKSVSIQTPPHPTPPHPTPAPINILPYLTGLSRLLQHCWANAWCQVLTSLIQCVPGSAYSQDVQKTSSGFSISNIRLWVNKFFLCCNPLNLCSIKI